VAEADALGETFAGQMQRPAGGRLLARGGERRELARGDHLGQYHRGRLQRLDLVLLVAAVRAVLHDEDAERVAAAQDRHAEEGVEDLLARLRLEGEGGVFLGVGEVQRLGRLGDHADEALAGAHDRVVDRLTVESLRRIQLER